MTVYVSDFGTDWTTLERTEILRRAFALGVAAACGQQDLREYERLYTTVDRAYDQSLVELAYGEGKQKGSKLRREVSDVELVWKTLVEDASPLVTGRLDRTRPVTRFDLPSSLVRIRLLDRPRSDSRDAVRSPAFLRR